MRVLVINPWDHSITEAEHSGHYKDYYRLLSGPTRADLPAAEVGCFNMVSLGDADGHLMFVDDEGLLVQPQRYFRLSGSPSTFAGRAVVTAGAGEEDEKAATISLETLAKCVTWLPAETEVDIPPAVIHGFDNVDDLFKAFFNRDQPDLLARRE